MTLQCVSTNRILPHPLLTPAGVLCLDMASHIALACYVVSYPISSFFVVQFQCVNWLTNNSTVIKVSVMEHIKHIHFQAAFKLW